MLRGLNDTSSPLERLIFAARRAASADTGRWRQAATALVLAAPLAALAWAAWGRRWMSDDGYIYLRVVDQLLAGNGPVFNRGERVEAATSPLWVALLSVLQSILPWVSLPWLAVLLGLFLTLLGVVLAQWGAYIFWQRGRRRVVLPLGSIVIAALPPFWDFATSGLETGLSFAWLGACFWGLVRLCRSSNTETGTGPRPVAVGAPKWLLVLIGLGPLVRPDLGIFCVGFMAIFFVVRPGSSWRERLRALVIALAVPFAYELFRMGYYGAVTPNPAFAKEATASNWPQGWRYLLDTIKPYWLPLPLLLALGIVVTSWPGIRGERDGRERARATAILMIPVAGALVHALYVVYIGGDFMHARLFLPDLFAMLLPVAVIAIDSPLKVVVTACVVAWAIVCMSALRVPYNGIGGIADERRYYVGAAGNPHPITPDDYRGFFIAPRPLPPRGELRLQGGGQIPIRGDLPSDAIYQAGQIGIRAYDLGITVHVLDLRGLADPLAGRLEFGERGRPGHEKILPEAWVVARFGDQAAPLPGKTPRAEDVIAARAALACGHVPDVIAAATDPMTPGRFARNMFEAVTLNRFRIPPDPKVARTNLC